MKQAFLIVLAVGLLGGSAAMALAQRSPGMGGPVPSRPSDDNWTGASKPGWIPTSPQAELTVDGKITEIDFTHRTMALDDGEQFTLPESLEYSSLPAIGQAVEVTFAEQNGQKVVRWIDLDDTANSHQNGD